MAFEIMLYAGEMSCLSEPMEFIKARESEYGLYKGRFYVVGHRDENGKSVPYVYLDDKHALELTDENSHAWQNLGVCDLTYFFEIGRVDIGHNIGPSMEEFIDEHYNKDGERVFFVFRNDYILEDLYGVPLRAIEPRGFLRAMKLDFQHDKSVRVEAAIVFLETVIRNFPQNTLRIVLYGY